MGILDRISRGIGRGIGNAVGNATQRAVERKATEVLTPRINEAADTIAGSSTRGDRERSGSLDGALGNLGNAVNGYATETAKNMKICAKCDAAVSAEQRFCSRCGEALPEKTLAESAVCTSCGRQNNLSEKFCSECGTKLPLAIEAEERERRADESVLLEWETKLPNYPKWSFGGTGYGIECYDEGYYVFCVELPTRELANRAVASYRELLRQHGFREAGQYPSSEHLYKKVDGVCYHVDTEHCFEGDANRPTIGFDNSEPTGGFDYVKPEPRKKGLFGLFK